MSAATNPGAGGGSSVSGSSLPTAPTVSNGRRGLLRTGGRRWLDNDIARLRALIAQGKTHAECAAVLGRTKRSVSCAAEQYRMTNPYSTRWTADEMRTLLLMKKAGKTAAQIAAHLGKTKCSVETRWQKLRGRIQDRRNIEGFPKPVAKPVSKAQFAAVAERVFAEGGYWRDVAAALGVSPNTARQRGSRMMLKAPRPPGRPVAE